MRRRYAFVVLQATDQAIPFYESMGFSRVGCVARAAKHDPDEGASPKDCPKDCPKDEAGGGGGGACPKDGRPGAGGSKAGKAGKAGKADTAGKAGKAGKAVPAQPPLAFPEPVIPSDLIPDDGCVPEQWPPPLPAPDAGPGGLGNVGALLPLLTFLNRFFFFISCFTMRS